MPSREKLLEIIRLQTDMAALGLDLGGVMALVVDRALPLMGADGAAVELAEDGDMVYRAASGIAAGQLGLRLKIESSLSGLCVRTGQPFLCADSETDTRADREACRRIGLRSMAVMPLRHRDSTVGVLKVMARAPDAFQAADIRLLELLTGMLGAVLYWATRYDAESLFHKATHDDLTGLPNRALFMDRLRNVLSQQGRQQRPAAVLMIDMDGLKAVNDTYGHRAGDAAIREFGHRLRQSARLSDTVARLGGDEFAVILTPVEPGPGVDSAIHRLSEHIRRPFAVEGQAIDLSGCIGGAVFPEDGAVVDDLLHLADQRMYAVKSRRPGSRAAAP